MISIEELEGLVLEKKYSFYCQEMRMSIEEIAPDVTFTGLLNRPIDFTALHIEKQLGKGSFGAVSLATYKQERVAVKELEGDAMRDIAVLRDFQRELWIGW